VKSRHAYKGCVIEALACELKDGGFSAEFSAEERDASASLELSSIYLHSGQGNPRLRQRFTQGGTRSTWV
jgi:hypothetical protein